MKRMLAGFALALGTAALSGCYYDPGYSYVRGNGYQGDAYYGEGPSVIYQPDYYGYDGPGYYGPGWGYYGCCYSSGVSVGISGTWYGGGHRGRDWRGHRHGDRDGGRRQGHDGRHGRGDPRGHRGRDRH